MRRRSALLPLAIAAGLFGASPAMAASHHGPTAHAAGGDAPPVIPSIVQTRITRTESALERLSRYVDNQQSTKVVKVGKVIRRQTSAAWRGAVYYLKTAPPPVAEAGSLRTRKRSLKGGAIGPVVADQYQTAGAAFDLVHQVAAQSEMLVDGAHGNTLLGLSRTLFWTLDKRDAMVPTAQKYDVPPAPAEGRTASKNRSLKDGPPPGFAGIMPEVTLGLDDEMQQIDGLRADATDLTTKGKAILRDAETQTIFTERNINTIWPPAPAAG